MTVDSTESFFFFCAISRIRRNQRILAPRDSPITKVSDLSGKRVCVAKKKKNSTMSTFLIDTSYICVSMSR
ncbi:hypothetical protein FVP46_08270 [Mycobacterium tuberculosis]|nr:hypothetical protein [Mycobacterium tuberculosis]